MAMICRSGMRQKRRSLVALKKWSEHFGSSWQFRRVEPAINKGTASSVRMNSQAANQKMAAAAAGTWFALLVLSFLSRMACLPPSDQSDGRTDGRANEGASERGTDCSSSSSSRGSERQASSLPQSLSRVVSQNGGGGGERNGQLS